MSRAKPLIFDIVRSSFVDGPGVRTTVFFKGCPLSCPWCHNPESQSYHTETMFFQENCIQCGNCDNGKECFTLARRTVGKEYSPAHLAQILLEDKPYYDESGGGVTFSGGEALSFIPYLSQVVQKLKKKGIHIAVQTCGYFDFDSFSSKLLPYIDLLFFDFKIMDDEIHSRLLDRSNRLLLQNFKKLLVSDIEVIPRIPLVPHFVANNENLDTVAKFFSEHGVGHCEFLYYHPGGKEKLIRLGRKLPKNFPEKMFMEPENKAWIKYFQKKWQKYMGIE